MVTMEKGTLIKLAVVLVVLVFVVQIIFIWGGRGKGEEEEEGISGSGVVQTNATIGGYARSLTVVGYDPLLEEAKNNLTRMGLITYTVPIDPNTTIYNLADGVTVGEVASRLERLNVSLYSRAYLILPSSLNVTMEDGEIQVPAIPIDEEIDPTLLTGDTITIRFGVYIINNEIARLGSIEIVPQPKTIPASARVLNITGASYALLVPWEQRRINRSALDGEFRSINASFNYRELSFISTNLTQGQINTINALGLQYVAAVSPITISIQTTFANRSAILSDLSEFADVLSFPNSTITLGFEGAVGEWIEGNISAIMEGHNLSYGMERSETLLLELPITIIADKNYTLRGGRTRSVIAPGFHAINETLNVSIDGKVISNRIERIEQIDVD